MEDLTRRTGRLISSIRFRLTLWYIAILSLVLLVFGALIVSSEVRNNFNETDTILSRQAQILVSMYSPASGLIDLVSAANREALSAASDHLALRDLDIFILFDMQSAALQQNGRLDSADLTALGRLTANRSGVYENYQPQGGKNIEGTTYRVYAIAILQHDQRVATLMVGRLQQTQRLLQSFIMELAVLIPVIVVITALGAYWLASRTLAPVRAITRAAREIGETDLSRRLNLAGHDEIAELAATFDQMLGRLDGAFARQRQFTHDASHELRTPLTIVNLELHRLQTQRRAPEEYERALATIQFENQYMTRLVNDLLTLARADAGQVTLRGETLDLSDLALEVIERLAALAQQSQIELSVGQLPEVTLCGDRLFLTQMLTNLIENAIKYTSGVGGRVGVEVGCRTFENREWAWVQIKDDGIGIAAEHLPRLFDRFYQVDNARVNDQEGDQRPTNAVSGGSGLGLSIVHWIVQMHGGRLVVRSQPHVGSTFEVYLPMSCAPMPPN